MPTARPATTLLAAAALAATAEAFTAPGRIHLSAIAPQRRCSQADIHAGLFDNLFGESEEQKRQKEEAWKAQQEMLARRRNPEKGARKCLRHRISLALRLRGPSSPLAARAIDPLAARAIDRVLLLACVACPRRG